MQKKHLVGFQQNIGAEHALQVAFGLYYVEKDCFAVNSPVIVPATIFSHPFAVGSQFADRGAWLCSDVESLPFPD